MIDMNDFSQKEKSQSHSFIFFENGPPYCELGWLNYKSFNWKIYDALSELKKEHGIEVYLHEHEVVLIERMFLWCFSFFESHEEKRNDFSHILSDKLAGIISQFGETKDKIIINNHDEDFFIAPDWGEYYVALIDGADHELRPAHPPKEKSYQKEDLDLKLFDSDVAVSEFNEIIQSHLHINSIEDISYMYAIDGFQSNKYRSNKYLREELIPASYFIKKFNICDSARIKLGIERDNFDVKIKDEKNDWEIILEITLACPKNDHLLLSLSKQTGLSAFPLKTRAYLKKEADSLPGKIVQAINKKHQKGYQDKRILMVVVQSEYTYQGEDYVINEILKEVREMVPEGRGRFQGIIMLCGRKFYGIF